MAAPQPIENQQRSYEVFEQEHYMERTTQPRGVAAPGAPRGPAAGVRWASMAAAGAPPVRMVARPPAGRGTGRRPVPMALRRLIRQDTARRPTRRPPPAATTTTGAPTRRTIRSPP